MARVYVKGYVRADGSRVKGHYREMSGAKIESSLGAIAGKLKAEGLTAKSFTLKRANKVLSATVGRKFNMAAARSYPRRLRGLLKAMK